MKMPKGEITSKSLLVVVLSHSGNESVHRTTVRQLKAGGYKRVKVKYGPILNKTPKSQSGAPVRCNEVCHFAFMHCIAPYVKAELQKKRPTTGVLFLEADAQIADCTFKDLQDVMEAHKASPETLWIGWHKVWPLAKQRYKWDSDAVQGSHGMLSWGAGLQKACAQAAKYRPLGLLLSTKHKYHRVSEPVLGFRGMPLRSRGAARLSTGARS